MLINNSIVKLNPLVENRNEVISDSSDYFPLSRGEVINFHLYTLSLVRKKTESLFV